MIPEARRGNEQKADCRGGLIVPHARVLLLWNGKLVIGLSRQKLLGIFCREERTLQRSIEAIEEVGNGWRCVEADDCQG
jgi:hypothetical protein